MLRHNDKKNGDWPEKDIKRYSQAAARKCLGLKEMKKLRRKFPQAHRAHLDSAPVSLSPSEWGEGWGEGI